MTRSVDTVVNLPLLAAFAARKRRRQVESTGAVMEFWLGRRKVVAHVCNDHVLRVDRSTVASLLGVTEDELQVLPEQLGQVEIRMVLNCTRTTPENMPAAQLLSALQGELRRAQSLMNLSGPRLKSVIRRASPGSVITPTSARRLC